MRHPKVKVTVEEDGGPLPPLQAVEVALTLLYAKINRLSYKVRSVQHPAQPQWLAEAAKTMVTRKRSVSTSGTLSAP